MTYTPASDDTVYDLMLLCNSIRDQADRYKEKHPDSVVPAAIHKVFLIKDDRVCIRDTGVPLSAFRSPYVVLSDDSGIWEEVTLSIANGAEYKHIVYYPHVTDIARVLKWKPLWEKYGVTYEASRYNGIVKKVGGVIAISIPVLLMQPQWRGEAIHWTSASYRKTTARVLSSQANWFYREMGIQADDKAEMLIPDERVARSMQESAVSVLTSLRAADTRKYTDEAQNRLQAWYLRNKN